MRLRNHLPTIAGLLALTLTGCGGGGNGSGGSIEPLADEGNSTIQTTQTALYNTDPPASGPHYDLPTTPGFYDTTQAAGFLVHSLEHSNVVLYYDRDRLSSGEIDALRALAARYTDPFVGLVVTPRSDANFKVIATAWRRRLRLSGYDALALQAFIDQFIGKGPVTGPHIEIEPIEDFADEGHTHVSPTTKPTYRTDPPTSGSHYPTPAANGFYTNEVQPGNLVHSLEHSNIVLYYDKLSLTSSEQDSLRALVARYPNPFAGLIAVPRIDSTHRFIATAWQHRLRLKTAYDVQQLQTFIDRFRGKGPEQVPHTY